MRELLTEAKFEIVNLRRRNEILEAQMAVLDVIAAATGLKKQGSCETIDVVWQIDKKLGELEASQACRKD